uniref:Uncharacterized protein n=1 Tax=Arundo donax TaxID=35708 RepID=A0A0A9AKH9_ARUDO
MDSQILLFTFEIMNTLETDG